MILILKRTIIKVFGLVQGVFFRYNTKGEAEKLGLTGWVRNEDDGTVLIVSEGKEDKLRELIKWCKSGGPRFAKIERIEVKWSQGTGEFNGFSIQD